MLHAFLKPLEWAVDQFWSGPLLLLLLFIGMYQTYSLRGLQFFKLGYALKLIFKREKADSSGQKGDISSFQSLMTALAGAIGTGNITGIATAVVLGGFGALFWMWIIALLGMATAYSEVVLAVRFRVQNKAGEMIGGPMYTLERGLNAKKLAILYAIFGACAAVCLGAMVQSNSVADALERMMSLERVTCGLLQAITVGAVILGGIKSIGRFAGIVVPFMALAYLLVGLIVLSLHFSVIPQALGLIVKSAFSGQAALGGFVGASVVKAMQMGASNGLFANEAGLGSLPIAAASAQVQMPARQGFYAISGVFVSTMVVCTITGLVLAVTDVLGMVNTQGEVITGSPLAMIAFGRVLPEFEYIVVLGLIFFALTTIVAWAYYGEKCIEYLVGMELAHLYRWVYTMFVFAGAVLKLELVWLLAHFFNALMALPNLYAIFRLSRVVQVETNRYFEAKG